MPHAGDDALDRALRDLGVPPRPPLPTVSGAQATHTAHPSHAARPSHPAAPATQPPTPPAAVPYVGGRWARVTLAIYLAGLVLIAIWPVPVDSGAGPLIRAITRVFPVITHARLEFGANILLFVPLGALLAVILARQYLVVPIAFVTTVAIESVQALALDRRVPSVMDIVANVTGACVGLLLVAAVDWWRTRHPG
ncbi:VanZ family protein [Microbacterium aureliae]